MRLAGMLGLMLVAALVPGCAQPCSETASAATIEFPWNGTRGELVAAFAGAGGEVDASTRGAFGLSKEVEGNSVSGSARTMEDSRPGLARLTLTKVGPLPASRHCGAI